MSTDDEYINTDSRFGEQAGYYPATDFALPYLSKWSRVVDNEHLSGMLAHMNCSYLGQHGMPPTLLSLKRHAQSLVLLIQCLQPSLVSGAVDGYVLGDHDPQGIVQVELDANGKPLNVDDQGNPLRTYIDNARRRLENGDCFDWLHDLTNPYHNDDPLHHRPLNSLMNEVKSASDVTGAQFHCPLTEVVPRALQEDFDKNDIFLSEDDAKRRHYASHNNLVRHANECLEMLDHEFSATGGLLSMIPPDGKGLDAADFEAAKNSLLGQLLLHTQGMYLRMHEFELDVGNMRDALAKDAVAPLQALRRGGPDAKSGRELVVNQDRFVIVNAGNDTWRYLQDDFDVAEAQAEAAARIYAAGGAAGERQWNEARGGDQYVRGITTIDYTTRYYRLRGQGRSTIFIAPAFGRLPATGQTPQNEKNPGLLAMVQPRWPERVSDWERRYRAQIEAATELQRANVELTREREDARTQIDALQHTLDATRATLEVTQTAVDEQEARAAAAAAPGAAPAADAGAGPAARLMAEIQALNAQLASQRADEQTNLDARFQEGVATEQQRADDLARRNNELRDYFTQIQDAVAAQDVQTALDLVQAGRDSRFTPTSTPAGP